MKKILLLLIMFILCISLVSAINFETEVNEIKQTIEIDSPAQFEVTIRSNSTEEEEFTISSPEVEWNIPKKILIVQPGFEVTEDISISQTKHTGVGPAGIHLNIVQEGTGDINEHLLLVTVISSEEEEGYQPSVKMEVDMVRQAEPGESFTIRIDLANQNPLNLTDVLLIVESDLAKLNRREIISINPVNSPDKGESLVVFDYAIDAQQQPKAYEVNFALMIGDEIISSVEPRLMEVVSSLPAFKPVFETPKKSLLRSELTATYTNEGNVRNEQVVKIPIGFFTSKFTSTDGKITKEDGQRYITWTLNLRPSESRTVSATTNYRIIVYILIVIIAGLLVFFKFRKRLKIRKSVVNISTEEEGISQLKIMLDIVNSSGRELKDIKIKDVIPTIADVKKEFAEGTLKPSSILKHSSKGTIVKWNIPELAPGEERLISYDIRSKLSIIGSFTLPRGRITYIKDGKKKIVFSNSVVVST